MWRASKVCRATAELWTSAIITPIDCNVKAFEEFRFSLGFAAPDIQWKLRPIARPECLLKFIEGVLIQAQREEFLKRLEPHQLGVGTPDACPIVVTLLQSWLTEARDEAIARTIFRAFKDEGPSDSRDVNPLVRRRREREDAAERGDGDGVKRRRPRGVVAQAGMSANNPLRGMF